MKLRCRIRNLGKTRRVEPSDPKRLFDDLPCLLLLWGQPQGMRCQTHPVAFHRQDVFGSQDIQYMPEHLDARLAEQPNPKLLLSQSTLERVGQVMPPELVGDPRAKLLQRSRGEAAAPCPLSDP